MKRKTKTPAKPIDPWFLEQENRIEERIQEAARLRASMRRQFDPGYLYVVLFDSGVIKVGKSWNADSRLKAHSKTGFVRESWASPHHLGISANERQLIAFCAHFGTLYGGREYFTGVEFRHAVAFALLLARNSQRSAYLEALTEATDGDMAATWQAAHLAAFGSTDVTEETAA